MNTDENKKNSKSKYSCDELSVDNPKKYDLPHLLITGKAGHGKDSIGDHVVSFYGFERFSFSECIRNEVCSYYKNASEPITPSWLDTREVKEIAQQRLCLANCSENRFVETALFAFEEEDKNYFFDRKKNNNCQSSQSDMNKSRSLTVLDTKEEFLCLTRRMTLPRSPRRIQQIWGTEFRRAQNTNYWLDFAENKTDFRSPKVLTSVRYPNELEFGNRISALRIHVIRPAIDEAHQHITENLLPIDESTIIVENSGSLKDMCTKIDDVLTGLIRIRAESKAKKKICRNI